MACKLSTSAAAFQHGCAGCTSGSNARLLAALPSTSSTRGTRQKRLVDGILLQDSSSSCSTSEAISFRNVKNRTRTLALPTCRLGKSASRLRKVSRNRMVADLKRGKGMANVELPTDGLAALMESGLAERANDVASSSELAESGSLAGMLDSMENSLPPRTKLGLATGVKVLPHPEKVHKGGEDAYFVHLMRSASVLGVMDGVGGWADEGVDPALYSNEFVERCLEALEKPEVVHNPQLLLHMAHQAMTAPGAATAIVSMMDPAGMLRVAHVGDSALRIVRNGRVVFATEDMMHGFDCPYQFGAQSTDSAYDATVHELELEEGDVIVMASDGLFDNLYDRDLESVVELFNPRDPDTAYRTANALAALSRKHAGDPEYESPYIMEARANGYNVPFWQKMMGKKLTGGKMDDITVLVACVVDAATLPEGDGSDSDLLLDEHGSGNWVPVDPHAEGDVLAGVVA